MYRALDELEYEFVRHVCYLLHFADITERPR